MTGPPASSAAGPVGDDVEARGGRIRVLVGNSVYEMADVTVNGGRVFIEFDSEDLDDVEFPLAFLSRPGDDVEKLREACKTAEGDEALRVLTDTLWAAQTGSAQLNVSRTAAQEFVRHWLMLAIRAALSRVPADGEER